MAGGGPQNMIRLGICGSLGTPNCLPIDAHPPANRLHPFELLVRHASRPAETDIEQEISSVSGTEDQLVDEIRRAFKISVLRIPSPEITDRLTALP